MVVPLQVLRIVRRGLSIDATVATGVRTLQSRTSSHGLHGCCAAQCTAMHEMKNVLSAKQPTDPDSPCPTLNHTIFLLGRRMLDDLDPPAAHYYYIQHGS